MYKRYLNKLARTRLDDVLIDEGALERSHIDDAQAESEMTGRPLAHVLFEREEMDEWELAKIVARNYSLPFVDVVTYSTPREAEVLLDLEFCNTHLLLPFDIFGDLPAIAACEMPSAAVIDEIERRCGHVPFVYVTLRSRLLEELTAREESGVAPATAADLPPPRVGSMGAAAAGHAMGGGADELEPATMRLGFNMHMRSSKPAASSVAAPAPPPVEPRRPRPAPLQASPAPVAAAAPSPSPAAPPAPAPLPPAPALQQSAAEEVDDPVDSASQSTDEEGKGKAAAWQSIFDLGDDAVDA